VQQTTGDETVSENDKQREYDHTEFPENCEDPFAYIDSFREQRCPWSSRHGGFWTVTKQDDYLEIIRNTDVFKSLSTIPAVHRPLIPIFTDPPEHSVYRKFMGPILSPTAAKGWEEFTRETARSLVQTFVDDGRCEVLSTFSRPLALAVFGEFMGLAQDQIKGINDAVAEAGESMDASAQAVLGMFGALGAIVDERMETAEEGEDMPRRLARGDLDGRKLTRDELFNICQTMFIAGFDTTAGMLTISLRYLARDDDVRREIATNHSLIPQAVEEIVRLHAFVQSSRTARVDVDVAGVHMKAGDQVLLPTSMPNRDPEEIESPNEFDLYRFPNRHYGFGAGPHRCVGSHVARMEMRVALEEWLTLIPDFKTPEGYVAPFRNGHVIGIQELQLEWPT
jgi:cytochrome P450